MWFCEILITSPRTIFELILYFNGQPFLMAIGNHHSGHRDCFGRAARRPQPVIARIRSLPALREQAGLCASGVQSRSIEATKAINLGSINQDVEIAAVAPLLRNDVFGESRSLSHSVIANEVKQSRSIEATKAINLGASIRTSGLLQPLRSIAMYLC